MKKHGAQCNFIYVFCKSMAQRNKIYQTLDTQTPNLSFKMITLHFSPSASISSLILRFGCD